MAIAAAGPGLHMVTVAEESIGCQYSLTYPGNHVAALVELKEPAEIGALHGQPLVADHTGGRGGKARLRLGTRRRMAEAAFRSQFSVESVTEGDGLDDRFRLTDVLKAAGLRDQAAYVWFEGLDEIPRDNAVIPFGGSIPLQRALDVQTGALLAVEMNGAPLKPDHGFPLRSLVPGVIGARSVKWLGRIVVSDRPSANHYVRRAYKLVKTGEEDEWDRAQPIQEFPLNSAICVPEENAAVEPGTLIVRGYALAAGDFDIFVDRAELSVDQGENWTLAEWTSESRPFCWRLWQGQVNVDSRTRSVIVRAVDSRGLEQPRTVEWNFKGYLFNAWDRVPLQAI